MLSRLVFGMLGLIFLFGNASAESDYAEEVLIGQKCTVWNKQKAISGWIESLDEDWLVVIEKGGRRFWVNRSQIQHITDCEAE